ncbi:MAG: UDP-N-acetylglucosamine 2-epimerase, partial [Bacteroidales bacterium]|nr:UDP-N-acetylglucosamine 2-epimerase [Bacteroidales bacterium]
LQAISLKIPVVLPLHPGTRKKLIEYNIKITAPNLIIIEPVGYLEMIWLLQKCQLVITDSGGMQKEAFFFKKPCVTMRDETEWTELADYGYNNVAGRKKNDIISAYETMCHKELLFNISLYGDGNCAEQIVSTLKNYSS